MKSKPIIDIQPFINNFNLVLSLLLMRRVVYIGVSWLYLVGQVSGDLKPFETATQHLAPALGWAGV